MTDKRDLRDRIRAVRAAFAPGAPVLINSAFLARLRTGLVVASYRPIGEADPVPLARAALDAGCTLALPHVAGRALPMRFLAWRPGAALVPGPFGLEQPHTDAAEVAPDIVLTPLVAFDRRGDRIGQGAGYYDRAFAAHPDAWRVGVAWSVQETACILADPWDVPLHAVATEKEWITP